MPSKNATAAKAAVSDAAPSIAVVPISDLKPYARNARTHSKEQIDQIARSIEKFGFTNPILADADGVVAGHGRLEGAKRIYEKGGVIRTPNGTPLPKGAVLVLDCTGWDEEQRRAYIIADNQIALNSGWDFALLREEMAELRDADFDLTLMGFDDVEKILADFSSDVAATKENIILGGDRFLLMIEYPDEPALAKAYEQFSKEGLECKILS